jgi:hypothetical protein
MSGWQLVFAAVDMSIDVADAYGENIRFFSIILI